MAHGFIQSIREFIEGNKSVRRVADDVTLTSELILLVRMMLADGKLHPDEMQNFKRICRTAFGIPEDDIGQVMQYLKDFGYDTSAADAAAMFAEFAPERKRALLVHMLSIAKSDDQLDRNETDLIRRTALTLGMSAEDIDAARSEV
jgi:uncharacterized tellurite resistance protein B-like protein